MIKLLLIEDDSYLANSIEDVIHSLYPNLFSVKIAYDLLDAYDYFQESYFDILITDNNLQNTILYKKQKIRSGIDFISYLIKEKRLPSTTILYTAYISQEAKELLKELEITYLFKGIDAIDKLIEVLRNSIKDSYS